MNFAGMDFEDDSPSNFLLPENIHRSHLKTRKEYFNKIIVAFVESMSLVEYLTFQLFDLISKFA